MENNKTLDLRYQLYVLLKHWYIIIVFPVVAAVISFIYVQYFTVPMYSASTMVFVYRNGDGTASIYNEMNLGAQLVKDIAVILKSGPVVERTLNLLDNPIGLTKQQIIDKTDASVEKETRLLKISVTDGNPEEAARIANTLTEVLMDRFAEIMKLQNQAEDEFISIVENAQSDPVPISPHKISILIRFLFMGFLLGLGVVVLMEYMNNTIKSPEEIKWYTDMNVIAIIPKFQK